MQSQPQIKTRDRCPATGAVCVSSGGVRQHLHPSRDRAILHLHPTSHERGGGAAPDTGGNSRRKGQSRGRERQLHSHCLPVLECWFPGFLQGFLLEDIAGKHRLLVDRFGKGKCGVCRGQALRDLE